MWRVCRGRGSGALYCFHIRPSYSCWWLRSSLESLGALLALFLQKVAIVLAGFAVGGYLTMVLAAPLLGGTGIQYPGAWLCFLIGGILGAILLFAFFNWALIILSSMHGAQLILRSLVPPHRYFTILFALLAVTGIVIQATTYRRPIARAE